MQVDAPLVTVRLRVVKLLGHLGGKLNRSLVTGEDNQVPHTALLYICILAVWPEFSSVDHGHAFSHLVVSSEEMMKKFVAWDSERRLSFAVPFADMKPVIYLDPFLPRISELALSTSDRQTKVCHDISRSLHCLVAKKNLVDANDSQLLQQPESTQTVFSSNVLFVFDAGSSM